MTSIKNNKKPFVQEPKINREIHYPMDKMVRVVYTERTQDGTEGEKLNKVMSFSAVIRLARSKELDMIEINGNIEVPVIRLDQYDKYYWELKKAAKANAAKQKNTGGVKEVQLSTNISEHDIQTKANNAKKFIADGDKVKVVLRMRGRELGRREQSKQSLRDFISLMADVAVAESNIRDEGNCAIVFLKKK